MVRGSLGLCCLPCARVFSFPHSLLYSLDFGASCPLRASFLHFKLLCALRARVCPATACMLPRAHTSYIISHLGMIEGRLGMPTLYVALLSSCSPMLSRERLEKGLLCAACGAGVSAGSHVTIHSFKKLLCAFVAPCATCLFNP